MKAHALNIAKESNTAVQSVICELSQRFCLGTTQNCSLNVIVKRLRGLSKDQLKDGAWKIVLCRGKAGCVVQDGSAVSNFLVLFTI